MGRVGAAREAGVVVLLVAVFAVIGAREPRFLQPASINSILLWIPLLLTVAVGQMMVIVTRGIDVSVGSMVGLTGMLVGMTFRDHPALSVSAGLALGLLIGAVLGSINAALIVLIKAPPILATLGTMSAYRGLTFIVNRGAQIDSHHLPDGLGRLSLNGPLQLWGVTLPWLLALSLAVAVVGSAFLRWTRPGRNVFAIGSNPDAAALRGVPVGRVLFAVYTICGAVSGLAGVMYASRYGFVNPASAGQGFELTVIAAAVIGGTPVLGGSGSVFGVSLGCLLLGAINVALAVLGIAETWQTAVYGVVILAAVVVDTSIKTRQARLSA